MARKLNRRQLLNLYRGAGLSKTTATGAGSVASVLSSMQFAENLRRSRASLQQRAQSGDPSALSALKFQQSGLLPIGGGKIGGDGGGGGFWGLIPEIAGNLGEDLIKAATGFPQGVYETGKALASDLPKGGGFAVLGDILQGTSTTETKKKVVDPTIGSYKYLYGPALPGTKGNLSTTLGRIKEHPLQPILDIGTVASLGAGTAVRGAGLAARAGSTSPVTKGLVSLGSREGRAPIPLAREESVRGETAVPELERLYTPSQNRRLFQRFIGDPIAQRAQTAPIIGEHARRFQVNRALKGLGRQEQGMKDLTEQRAIEMSLEGVLPTLARGGRISNRLRAMSGSQRGLSPEELTALALQKRGISSQPLMNRAKGEAIAQLQKRDRDPESYRMDLAARAGVDYDRYTRLSNAPDLNDRRRAEFAEMESRMGVLERNLEDAAKGSDTLLARAREHWRASLAGEGGPGANIREDFPELGDAGVKYVQDLLDMTARPEFLELMRTPTEGMRMASQAWDIAIERQREQLGVTPEEHRQRIWATQGLLRGGRSPEELEAEFKNWTQTLPEGEYIQPNYIADVKAEVSGLSPGEAKKGSGTRDVGRRSAMERTWMPSREAYLEDSDLNLFKAGAFRTDMDAMLGHLTQVAKDINQRFFNFREMDKVGLKDQEGNPHFVTEKEAAALADTSDNGEWAWVAGEPLTRWFNTETNVLHTVLKIIGDNPELHNDELRSMLEQLAETEARKFDQEELAATHGRGHIVPRTWYDHQMKLNDISNYAPTGWKGLWQKGLNLWRAATLAFMPRWWVNTVVGTTVLNSLKGVGPGDYVAAARRLAGTGKAPPGIALGGGVIRAENPGSGRKLFKAVQSFEDFMRTASAISSLDRLEKQALREMDSSMRSFPRRAFTAKFDTEYIDNLLADNRNVEIAMDEVNRFSYNFMQLGPFERKYIRQYAVPFWGWYRFVTKFAWSLPFDYPGRMQVIQNLGNIGTEANDDISAYMPSWMRGAIVWNKQDPRNIKYLSTMGLNPFSDFANPAAREGAIPGLLMSSQFNPLIQSGMLGAGIDPMNLRSVSSSPETGLAQGFLGRWYQEGKPVEGPGSVGGIQRALGGLLRSAPQVRTAEQALLGGRSVYPESVPFFNMQPIDVKEQSQRSAADLLLGTLGVNLRHRNLVADRELLSEEGEYAASKARNDLRDYRRFKRRTYGQ